MRVMRAWLSPAVMKAPSAHATLNANAWRRIGTGFRIEPPLEFLWRGEPEVYCWMERVVAK
jgi:hypothetical protein